MDYTCLASRRRALPTSREERTILLSASLAFDHARPIDKDPRAAANWYVDRLGGRVARRKLRLGAQQIQVSRGGAMPIVRGQRLAERTGEKSGLRCGRLRAKSWGSPEGIGAIVCPVVSAVLIARARSGTLGRP